MYISSSLGMTKSPQDISKKYKRQGLGMPKASPSSSSTKISGHLSRHYIFIASYIMCYSWSISSFCFQFVLFSLLLYMVGSQHIFFGERRAPFSLLRTLQFSLLLFCECSLFASTVFSSCFPLVFCSYLDVLLQFFMISSLVFDDYYL